MAFTSWDSYNTPNFRPPRYRQSTLCEPCNFFAALEHALCTEVISREFRRVNDLHSRIRVRGISAARKTYVREASRAGCLTVRLSYGRICLLARSRSIPNIRTFAAAKSAGEVRISARKVTRVEIRGCRAFLSTGLMCVRRAETRRGEMK